MPALFADHLISKAVFLSLDDLSDGLPQLREYIGKEYSDPKSPPDYDADDQTFWTECSVALEGDHAAEYERVEKALVDECQELLRHGNMKLLGTMLAAGLGYPDKPWDWGDLGYYADSDEDGGTGQWITVVTPADMDQTVVMPKERALIEICQREVAAGNQVWVYVQMTDKRDVQGRLEQLLTERGMKVKILRQKTVTPKRRLEWIETNGPRADVVISHPQLVQTGVDFFGKDRSYNFSCIVFYETGYSIYTLRQAAARHWRLLQWKKCRVYYLAYRGTMQEKAMQLMARKMGAATQLDGELNLEGLTALDDQGSAQMALARSIGSAIEDSDIARNWAKIGKPKPAQTLALTGARSIQDQPISGVDTLPMGLALVAETILGRSSGVNRTKLAQVLGEFNLTEADLAAMSTF